MALRLTLALAVSVMLTTSVAAAPNMQDGRWEVTSRTEMEGMPMTIPPSTHTTCLTRDKPVPEGPRPDQQCKTMQSRVEGDTVSWTIQCRNAEGEMDGTGRLTYRGTTFDGHSTITVKSGTDRMKMNIRMTGKRIGPCN